MLTIDIESPSPLLPGYHDSASGDAYHLGMSGFSKQPTRNTPDSLNIQYSWGRQRGSYLKLLFDGTCSVEIIDSLWSAGDCELRIPEGGYYTLNLCLSGDYIELINQEQWAINTSLSSFCHCIQGVDYWVKIPPQTPIKVISLNYNTDFLKTIFNTDDTRLHQILHPNPDGSHDDFYSQCTISPALQYAAYELFQADPRTPTYRLFVKAQVLKLLALYLQALETQPITLVTAPVPMLQDQRFYLAKAYLDNNFEQVPSIDMLSRHVGMSRSKLLKGFKQIFDTTIYDYIQNLRMEKAMVLLRQGRFSIRFIAEYIGYSHQGSFSKAFKRHTGLSPRDFVASVSRG